MPSSKPPGRRPPGRKPPARKPDARKAAAGRPRDGKAAGGWKAGSRKAGAHRPGGPKQARGRKAGARKPDAKSASWKPPGRKRDTPPRAARPRRDGREQWPDESSEASVRSAPPEPPREALPRDLIRRKPWLQMPPRRENPAREAPAREAPLPAAGLETSHIRRGLREVIADVHATGADARRARVAAAETVAGELLERVAAPLFRTVASVLSAEGYRFIVSTPPGAVRLSSAASGDDYVELVLDARADPPALLVRTAHVRRDEGVIDERVVAQHPAIGTLTDTHLFAVLITALRLLVGR